jgi:hypothetical protein
MTTDQTILLFALVVLALLVAMAVDVWRRGRRGRRK